MVFKAGGGTGNNQCWEQTRPRNKQGGGVGGGGGPPEDAFQKGPVFKKTPKG